MKKLTYIANIRMPTEKAHGQQIMQMCEAFADNGLEVELIVSSRKTPIEADPFEYYKVKRNFTIRRIWSLDLVRFGSIGFWIQALTFAESAAWHSLTKKGIFYTRDELNAFFLAAMGKRVGWEVHMGQSNVLAKLLLRLGVPLITITHGLKDAYVRLGVPERRILVAHDAYDPKRFEGVPARAEARRKLGLDPESFVVAYIGKYTTMGQAKGVEDLISPFAALHAEHPHSFLLIVGPNEDEVPLIEQTLLGRGLSQTSFRIVSHVPHGETSIYMRAADLLTLPYPNTPHYARNMSPLKLFSSMGSGTAILASDLPSLREVLTDESAFFFDPDKPHALQKVLEYAITHRDEAVEKARRALEDSKRYTWYERARSILEFVNTA